MVMIGDDGDDDDDDSNDDNDKKKNTDHSAYTQSVVCVYAG